MRSITALPCVLFTLLVACDAKDDATPASPPLEAPDIAGAWDVQAFGDAEAMHADAFPTPPTVRFTADGRFEAHSACTTLSATYTLEGDALTFADMETVELECEAPSAQDTQLMTTLKAVNRAQRDDASDAVTLHAPEQRRVELISSAASP